MRAARWVGDGLRRAVTTAAGALPGSTREERPPTTQGEPAEQATAASAGAPSSVATLLASADPVERPAAPFLTREREESTPAPEPLPAMTLPAASGELSAHEVAALRTELQAEVARLHRELHSSEADLAGLIADSVDGSGDDQADAGAKTFEREHEMSVSANTREVLGQAERALTRIAQGTYGLCESCGNPIGKRRLQAFPRATLCIACKQRQERR